MPHTWSPRNLKPSKPEEATDEICKVLRPGFPGLQANQQTRDVLNQRRIDFRRYLRDNRDRVVHVVPAAADKAAADAAKGEKRE